MNKKILISLSVIAAVAAIAIGGTIAYFSDTETSTGNTFTAGKLDLKFQSESGATWTDVNGAPLFDGATFPLNDLKPGDKGEKTVKLWVDNNPACGKVTVNVYDDKDNTCTEPELINDQTCTTTADSLGELNDKVNFLVWKDNYSSTTTTACDNVMNGTETPLVSGPIVAGKYSIGELPTSTADCYGIAYCFGDWTAQGACDGSQVDNAAQTDSFSADLTIDALQKRHQFGVNCPSIGPWPNIE